MEMVIIKEMRIKVIIVCVFMVILIVSGCGGEEQKDAKKDQNDTLQVMDETSSAGDLEKDVSDESDKVVHIKDVALEKLIRETIHKETGDISLLDMLDINRISINYEEYPVYELDGLEYATNLENFSYRGGKLKSLKPILNNEEVYYLGVSYSEVEETNIEKINMPNLEKVSFIDTNLQDFSFLKEAIRIKGISISESELKSIDFLQDMKDLEECYLPNNEISDIASLENKENLTTLNLQSNMVTDISPLASCENLYDLTLSYNLFEDISPLFELNNLAHVSLYEEIATPLINKKEIERLIETGVYVEYHE